MEVTKQFDGIEENMVVLPAANEGDIHRCLCYYSFKRLVGQVVSPRYPKFGYPASAGPECTDTAH